MTLQQELEKFLQDNLFMDPDLLFKEFRSRFGQHAMLFKDIPDKPEGTKIDTYLVVNGTEVFAVCRGVKAELQGR